MKVKVKNTSETTVCITGFPAIDAGETVTVNASEAKTLLANPNLVEVGKKEKSLKGVSTDENSATL